MKALIYSKEKGLQLEENRKIPHPEEGEALIKVTIAGICSTDLEILKDYVPGYNNVLGHEFVGVVEACSAEPSLVGKRVVGEINCPLNETFKTEDPIFLRNHHPERTVFGIIQRDGALGEYTTLPARNLHVVPDTISDKEAAFVEPLAAACRILEQQVIRKQDKVAIIGDGKLGLLVAQIVALTSKVPPLHIGRHQEKLDLVQGTEKFKLDEGQPLQQGQAQAYDVCIEASGSSRGMLLALQLCRPLGTIVQKSTCSAVGDQNMPSWSDIANDIVVNEKVLVGSRCGPFPPAIQAMQNEAVKKLLGSMITAEYPISEGKQAFERAQTKGILKVQVRM